MLSSPTSSPDTDSATTRRGRIAGVPFLAVSAIVRASVTGRKRVSEGIPSCGIRIGFAVSPRRQWVSFMSVRSKKRWGRCHVPFALGERAPVSAFSSFHRNLSSCVPVLKVQPPEASAKRYSATRTISSVLPRATVAFPQLREAQVGREWPATAPFFVCPLPPQFPAPRENDGCRGACHAAGKRDMTAHVACVCLYVLANGADSVH